MCLVHAHQGLTALNAILSGVASSPSLVLQDPKLIAFLYEVFSHFPTYKNVSSLPVFSVLNVSVSEHVLFSILVF